jgi:DNA-binding response OmpR family regulator
VPRLPGEALRVLVFSPDHKFLDRCSYSAAEAGIDVSVAADASMAAEYVCFERFDLLILDSAFPFLPGGRKLLEAVELRALPYGTKVLACTGAGPDRWMSDAVHAWGALALVQKVYMDDHFHRIASVAAWGSTIA